MTEVCDMEEFVARCGRGEAILMTHARYGRMQVGRCVERTELSVGCSLDVLPIVDRRCSGRSSCFIAVPDSELEGTKPCSKELRSYLEIAYKCVKVCSNVATVPHVTPDGNVTSPARLPLTGYYSSVLSAEMGCKTPEKPWTMRAGKGQTISLTLYDISGQQLQAVDDVMTSSCREYGYVDDNAEEGSQPKPLCISTSDSGRKMTNVYSSRGNLVKFWPSNTARHNFILEYNVIGCADVEVPSHVTFERRGPGGGVLRCKDSGAEANVTCQGNTWLGDTVNCSQGAMSTGTIEVEAKTGIQLSLGAASSIIVIAALLVCVIILLVGFLRYRATRHRSRRRHKHDSNMALNATTSSSGSSRLPCSSSHNRSSSRGGGGGGRGRSRQHHNGTSNGVCVPPPPSIPPPPPPTEHASSTMNATRTMADGCASNAVHNSSSSVACSPSLPGGGGSTTCTMADCRRSSAPVGSIPSAFARVKGGGGGGCASLNCRASPVSLTGSGMGGSRSTLMQHHVRVNGSEYEHIWEAQKDSPSPSLPRSPSTSTRQQHHSPHPHHQHHHQQQHISPHRHHQPPLPPTPGSSHSSIPSTTGSNHIPCRDCAAAAAAAAASSSSPSSPSSRPHHRRPAALFTPYKHGSATDSPSLLASNRKGGGGGGGGLLMMQHQQQQSLDGFPSSGKPPTGHHHGYPHPHSHSQHSNGTRSHHDSPLLSGGGAATPRGTGTSSMAGRYQKPLYITARDICGTENSRNASIAAAAAAAAAAATLPPSLPSSPSLERSRLVDITPPSSTVGVPLPVQAHSTPVQMRQDSYGYNF